MAFEHVVRNLINHDESTYDRQSTCYETFLRFQIWLTEMFYSLRFLWLMENLDKSGAMEIWRVFWTREHIDSWRVF